MKLKGKNAFARLKGVGAMDRTNRYLVSTNDVSPLPVGEDEGFRGVDSRLLICDATVGETHSCLFRAVFPPGGYHGNHLHHKSDELLFCISGEAIQAIKDVEYRMKPGDAMRIPKGVPHWMKNDGKVPFVVIGVYPDAKNFDDSDQELVDGGAVR
jgi:mannose-6-phosphate isomerase-like protein (cupin superfamily)